MTGPSLNFFCELKVEPLLELFSSDQIIDSLKRLDAGISMGILDLSSERAGIVKKLNIKGIPVIGWLLLPEEDGYWFNIENLQEAIMRYEDFLKWTKHHDLNWDAIGLDIEPSIIEMKLAIKQNPAIIPKVTARLFDRRLQKKSEKGYQELVNRIQSDGYLVESYQIPLIEDERRVGSSLIRRLGGLVDIQVDREVWMLYSSLLRPHGIGILGSYAPEAQAIGVGVTGGGVDIEFGSREALRWEELKRDLLLAWYWCDNLYIFSLEGCVEQGFLPKLIDFQWDRPIVLPEVKISSVDRLRGLMRTALWMNAHSLIILLSIFSIFVSIKLFNKYKN